MAVEMHLKIDGIDGEAQAKDRQGWIDMYSFSLGASNPTSVGTGTGSGAGKVSISSMSIQKSIDNATPTFFLKCCNGQHFATGKVVCREAGGEAPVEYLMFEFEQVFVDSVSWGGASGGDKPSESCSFSFKTCKITYTPQSADGSAGTPIPAGWDLAAQTKL